MLNAPADFPAPGADAFLAPTGARVRIQRRNADGTLLISHHGSFPGVASGNQTVTRDHLHASQAAAIAAGLNAGAKNRNGRSRRRTVKA